MRPRPQLAQHALGNKHDRRAEVSCSRRGGAQPSVTLQLYIPLVYCTSTPDLSRYLPPYAMYLNVGVRPWINHYIWWKSGQNNY
jgi:hypothetical protein